MERKPCFGSIREVTLKGGFTKTDAKPECRECEHFRDCLRDGKRLAEEEDQREELRKQNMMAKIIDLSAVFSNDLGSCLLEFLNRIYDSPLGMILFRNLVIFYELPEDEPSIPLTIPMSKETLELLQSEEDGALGGTLPGESGPSRNPFFIRLVLIKRSFPNNRKANVGLIAHEVVRMFSRDDSGLRQIRKTLGDSERELFKKMDDRQRIPWLMKRWGFQEELEAMRQALSGLQP
ncbi:MAG: hypothetical protein N3G78_02565 [Desulfobacterota bacterium]|nr:hypothetical protein [Thermodesulfobacteriota bacterium]